MTPSALNMRGGPKAIHTRDSIITALQRYAALYGDYFTAAAFSPSAARWTDNEAEYVDRYYQGDPDTGLPWPSLNVIKSRFDNSFNEARLAAGLQPNKPGPGNRRKAGQHAPQRDVSYAKATRIIYRDRVDTGALDKANTRAARAEARVERLTTEMEALKAKAKTTKGKVDRTALDAARTRATEARTTATRLAAKLERAEATIASLRAEKRDLRAETDRARRLVAASENDVREVEVPVEVVRVVTKTVERPGVGEDVLDAARAAERAARDRERTAVARAGEAHEAYMDLVEAVNATRRRLTAAELAELRQRGPSGPAVLADALTKLARARRDGGREVLAAALTRVAAAAVSWRDRL